MYVCIYVCTYAYIHTYTQIKCSVDEKWSVERSDVHSDDPVVSVTHLDVLPAVAAVAEVTSGRWAEVEVFVLGVAADETRLLAEADRRDTAAQHRELVT